MMTEKDFDKKIKELLDSYEEPLPQGIWEGIESGLNSAGSRRKFKLYTRMLSYPVAAAVLIGMFFILGRPSSDLEQVTDVSPIAVIEDTPEEILEEEITHDIKSISVVKRGSSRERVADNLSKQKESKPATDIVIALEIQEEKKIAQSEKEADQAIKEDEKVTPKSDYKPLSEQVGDYYAMLAYESDEKDELSYNVGILSNILVAKSHVGEQSSSPMYVSGLSMSNRDVIEPVSDVRHHIPVTLGIQAQVDLNEHFSVGIGLNYSFLAAEYNAKITNQPPVKVKQSCHYLGIPISIYYNILSGTHFTTYASIGGSIEKGIAENYRWREGETLKTRVDKMEDLQFSINAGIGLEYRISRMLGIFFDPSVTYYFKSSEYPRTIRVDQPLQMRFELGARFHFGGK